MRGNGTYLIVRTTARPGGVSYLPEVLPALDAAGSREASARLLYCDGPFVGETTWPLEASPERRGSRQCIWDLFRRALDFKFDQVLMIEDDVIPTKNAIRLMLEMRVPADLAFISYFDSYECPEGTPHGLYRRPTAATDGWGFRYSQCLLIPSWTMEYLLDTYPDPHEMPVRLWDEARKVDYWEKGRRNWSDNAIGHAMTNSPWWQYGVFVPTLVRHIGVVSIAAPGSFDDRKVERNYPGDSFDALTLRDPLHSIWG